LAETSGTIRNEWQAISVVPSTYDIAFRGFRVLIHIVRQASSQAVCETYVTSCYTITEYSVKKTVNMHGTWYSETYSTTLASGDCILPAVEQKFTVTMYIYNGS
jgi:hypothetical protein